MRDGLGAADEDEIGVCRGKVRLGEGWDQLGPNRKEKFASGVGDS